MFLPRIIPSGGDSKESSSEVVLLLSIVVGLLNNASPLYGAPQTILKALKSWLYICSDSRMALNMVTASCLSIASTKFMADLVELSLEAHFKSGTVNRPNNLFLFLVIVRWGITCSSFSSEIDFIFPCIPFYIEYGRTILCKMTD